jgi:hypothetical protein
VTAPTPDDTGAPPTAATLVRLGEALRARGGLLEAALRDGAPPVAPGDPHVGALAAAGPRAAGRREDVAFVVEAVREGFLLHYRDGRLLRDDDPDLLLLAGDHLYALGLAGLAELGDLDAIAELADVISLAAQAYAEDRPDLAEAAWEAGAAAVGWGAGAGLQAAKAAARAGDPDAAEALRAAARLVVSDVASQRRRTGSPRRPAP